MTICPFCKVRQDIDLRHVHFRDLGCNPGMPCPQCETPLTVLEFALTPPVAIERCQSCHGMFFNPGELEYLLETQTPSVVWTDGVALRQMARDFDSPREIVYRKCPICQERMGHLNFGGGSGVILDRCGEHGVWLKGGEMRRLAEWWRAGGKHLHQNREAKRMEMVRKSNETSGGGLIEPPPPSSMADFMGDGWFLLKAAAVVTSWLLD